MSETEIAELKEELQKLTARLQLLEKKGSPSATVPSGQVVPLDVCEVVLEASEKPVQSLGAHFQASSCETQMDMNIISYTV